MINFNVSLLLFGYLVKFLAGNSLFYLKLDFSLGHRND